MKLRMVEMRCFLLQSCIFMLAIHNARNWLPKHSITFKSTENFRLITNFARVINNITLEKCSFVCSTNRSQISFNFMDEGKGFGKCEISEISSSMLGDSNGFIADDKYVYYEKIKEWPSPCEKNPCSSNGRCITTNLGFNCECPFPMGGKTCNDVTCDGRVCSNSTSATYIYQYDNVSVTWLQAQAVCVQADVNMQLATMKTDEEFQSVRQFLLNKYTNDGQQTVYRFWIGLKGGKIGRSKFQFRWQDDNSTLQLTNSWGKDRPERSKNGTNQCVNLRSGTDFDFNMDNIPCANTTIETFGFICQKKIPA